LAAKIDIRRFIDIIRFPCVFVYFIKLIKYSKMSDTPKDDLKRSAPEEEEEPQAEEAPEEDAWIGPMPSEQSAPVPAKKKKGNYKPDSLH